MSINEYLILLEEELKYLPKKKKKTYINIYLNKMNTELDNGTEEEKITSSMPDVHELALDIYKQEEIDYAKIKIRKDNSNNILQMLLNMLIFILTISGFIFLSIYMVYSSIKLIQLITLVADKEKLLISLFDITLIIFYLTIYIYLIDLVFLIIESNIEKIALGFKKEIHLKDISLVYLINKLFKKEHIIRTFLIIEAILLITFGITNIVCKTYIYRSFYKEAPTSFHKIIDNDYEYQTINIDFDEARVNFIKADTFKIEVYSEFERQISLDLLEDTLYIKTDEIKTFDLLQLFKEPSPVFNIYIKDNSQINFKLASGILSINDLTLSNINTNISLGNINISNVKTNIVEIKDNQKVKTSINDSTITDFNYSSVNGTIELNKNNITNVSIYSYNVNIKMNENKINKIEMTNSGDVELINNNIDDLNSTIGTCDFFISGGAINNSCLIKSSLRGNVTIGNLKAPLIEITTVGGDVVGRNLDANLKIETGSNLTLNQIRGNINVKALGNFVSISEIKGTNILIHAERSETSIKFVKSDIFDYMGVNAKSTLYFIFSKAIKAKDEYGKMHIDNDKSIIDNDSDLSLYEEYYQDVESKDISPNATERIYVKE